MIPLKLLLVSVRRLVRGSKRPERDDRRVNWRWGTAVLGCALALAAPQALRAQGNQIYLGTADYIGRAATNGYITSLSTNGTTIVTNAVATNGAVAFVSGNISPKPPRPGAPNDGLHYLIASSFAQPVQTMILRKPDFHLGDQITTNRPFVWCSDSNKVFVVDGTNVFAGEGGFVSISWSNGGPTNTYLISGAPATNTPQVSMYLTDINGGPTGAPAVPTNWVSLKPHYNSTITAANLALVGNAWWHASNSVGSVVLEVRTNGTFAGVEVLQVRPASPDHPSSVDVGTFLAPVLMQTNADHITPSVVARLGLTGPNNTYFGVQYVTNANGKVSTQDPHFGTVFATQPTTAPGQLVVVWFHYGALDKMAWPAEMDDYSAHWPNNFAQVAQKIYWTWDPADGFGLGQMGPPVVMNPSKVPSVTINYSAYVPRVAYGTNTLELRGTNLLARPPVTGPVLLHYIDPNKTSNSFLGFQFVMVTNYFIDYTTNVDVGTFLRPVQMQTNVDGITPYVSAGLGSTGPGNTYYAVQYKGFPTDLHAGDVLATQPTSEPAQLLVFWFRYASFNIAWPTEMDDYPVQWPDNFEQLARKIYWTWNADGTHLGQMGPPVVLTNLNAGTTVTIDWSAEVPPLETDPFSGVVTNTLELDKTMNELHARIATGRVLLHYINTRDQTNSLLGVEYVRVVSYSPDVVDDWRTGSPVNWYVGNQLQPATNNWPDMTSFPLVRKGIQPNNAGYVYQHTDGSSPMYGDVFAIKPTVGNDDVEVFWERTNFLGVVWPYEMHQYTARWPTNVPAKYELYARGSLGNAGKSVSLPSGMSPTLMPYQDPAGHASLSGNTFSSTFSSQPPLGGSGWSLLKYAPTNGVAFQVVRSVAHNDPSFFDLSLKPWDIGSEIVDATNAAASRFGYIYAPPAPASPHDWDRYDADTYAGTNHPTGQIFAVNKGKLEVWWSTTDANGTAWPTIVLLYTNWWPANAPKIVIASRNGTPLFTNGQAYAYYQNDPTQPGFNPNEEHVWPPAGTRFYALRNDLNRTNSNANYTSAPYALIKSPSLLNPNYWQYSVFGVLAEGTDWSGTNYTFRFPAQAGLAIVEPTPLDSLDSPVAPGTKAVAGPWWQGLNTNFFFAKAAGDDGHSTANLVMQYFYRIQAGFYFPNDYLTNQFVTNLFAALGLAPTNTPPANTPFPWLDLYANTPGTPQNVTYVVSWPASPPPLLSFAETLFAEKPAIGGGYLPAIAGNGTNVAVIYEQAMATGGVHSVQLILPTNAVSVPLRGLPADIRAITNRNYTVSFPDLPPDLRQRVWWNGNTTNLVFAGLWITEDLHAVAEPLGYLLLNVLTPRDKAELLALATNSTPADIAFQNAVNLLASKAGQVMQPGGNNQSPYDSLALTAGNARAGGYVTLAFDNNPSSVPDLELIQVGCPGYLGDVEDIQSPNPFDVKQTLQYSGDFGGNAGNYYFEWQRTLSVAGKPDTNRWTTIAARPGLVNVTIEGSGPNVLVDHFFRCRYQPLTNTLCAGGSAWSDGNTLAPGWIGRILGSINLFDQRFSDYSTYQVDTIVSMLTLAGPRWIGNVPLNQDASDLGLIQIYETVLKRGEQLSIDNPTSDSSDPNLSTAVDTALMDAAGRLADLYMLFGNEAYAEATDPTVSFGSQETTYATAASSIFCFEGDANAPTLLDQELALLRGRDDSFLLPVQTYPVYNRLWWNTSGANVDGTVAYVNTLCGGEPTNGPSYFPQGHGDAWSHYLTALTVYYGMFRNPKFTMIPALDIEAVLVGGVTVDEGLMHERKFAAAAAARAQTGLDIINLTYRRDYQEDPAKQWQGYYDANTNRAWGVSEWGIKAGQAAYSDWVTANAILPHLDTNAADAGTIAKVDRTTVTELGQVASTASDIQSQLDNADQGLNPLGVAKNIVPMDVDPSQVSQGVSHFQQIYNKAVAAMNNALAVFDYARQSTQALRQQADNLQQFNNQVANQEADYNNQLITIFGTPYPQDTSYPPGYNGPDINNLHFNYIDYEPITGVAPPTAGTTTINFSTSSIGLNGALILTTNAVTLSLADDGLQFVKPAAWTQPRQSPGTIQKALGDLLQAHQKFNSALQQYDNLLNQIQDQADLLESQYGVNANQINILNRGLNTQETLDLQISSDRQNELFYSALASQDMGVANAMAAMIPQAVGMAPDILAVVRGGMQLAGVMIPAVSLGGPATDTHALQNAVQTFINGAARDGNGVSDIKLLFQTFTYTGQ